jgi:thioesterase domain-containing protein
VAVFDGIRAAMPPDQPVYALEDRSHNPRARSMEAMAAEYCKAVRRRWPHDIIHLAGYSFSGILAYEMARQLIADGQPIGLLAIIDTGPSHLSREGAMKPIRALWAFMSNVPRWIHEDLIRASWDEAPVRLRRSTSNLAKQLFTLGRSHFRPAATDLFDVTGWTKSQRAQVDLNLRALERFTYRPYPGRLFLFRASTRPLFQSLTRDLGWGAIARELQIVHVPGNHETITRCPRVGILSAALNAALLESSGQPSAAVPVHKAGGMCETA